MRLSLLFLLICVRVFPQSFSCQGLERTYEIHVPSGYNASKAVPLVVVLHGGGGNAARMGKFSGFNRLSDRDTFIAVYPQAYDKHWNDGRNLAKFSSQQENVDDVGFISALLDTVQKKYKINPERIYACGLSNGGMMCYRLACELNGKIKAFAAVIANLPELRVDSCKPGGTVNILIMNGTDDPIMPFNGGAVRAGKGTDRGQVLSTSATLKFWLGKDICIPEPLKEDLPDLAPDDGCRVSRETYSCESGHEIVLYTINGGGHNMPGCSPYLPKRFIGNTCRDILGSEEIWKFFRRH